MKSQEKQAEMATTVVQKVLSANITVNMLLGARSWVLSQLGLSTMTKGVFKWLKRLEEDVTVPS